MHLQSLFFFSWDYDFDLENTFKTHDFLRETVLRNQESDKCKKPIFNWFHFASNPQALSWEGVTCGSALRECLVPERMCDPIN